MNKYGNIDWLNRSSKALDACYSLKGKKRNAGFNRIT
jgi:hypothetical protein